MQVGGLVSEHHHSPARRVLERCGTRRSEFRNSQSLGDPSAPKSTCPCSRAFQNVDEELHLLGHAVRTITYWTPWTAEMRWRASVPGLSLRFESESFVCVPLVCTLKRRLLCMRKRVRNSFESTGKQRLRSVALARHAAFVRLPVLRVFHFFLSAPAPIFGVDMASL